ncbi:Arylsulfatase precursor [Rubripirellula tenax]|uniref:Arylsulfatase n=1 Tax=Rubripirellula tenax TaxID=2528015 RepID=A0A5C6F923_9BACT|nr:sulfatase [Rubripirellula tenax]TWU56656.1 Arylsulfatase precursor [Rubripirellula tenax]
MTPHPFAFCLYLLAGTLTLNVTTALAERPNFVILIADDVSYNDLGCFGSLDARTPRINALAMEGLRFSNAFLTASSCSPSRSSIITGRYPHNNGQAAELHQAISGHLPSFTGTLRDNGYFTCLAGKHHMTWDDAATVAAPTEPFDKVFQPNNKGNSGGHANWINAIEQRPVNQPFCFWFASLDAHRDWDSDQQWDEASYGPMHEPDRLHLPPAFVDTPETREDFASYLNEVTRFDHFVGRVIDRLKVEGVFDNTYIFVLADNGRPFPRAKTRLHDDGMQTYLIATGPKIQRPGAVCDSLVSVIDIAPTITQLAGAEKPESFQGESMLPLFEDLTSTIRPYAFSEHNWHDYESLARSVRDGRWLLIKNFRPQFAMQGPADSVRSPTHQALRSAAASAEPLTPIQADVLAAPRPETELYDTAGDPHQIHNLADDPKYAVIQSRLLSTLRTWREKTGDDIPEKITPDFFDRDTGDSLHLGKAVADQRRQPYPGNRHRADTINHAGF